MDSVLYVLCNEEGESINHLFFKCDFRYDVWNNIFEGYARSTLNKDGKVMLIRLPMNGKSIPLKIL